MRTVSQREDFAMYTVVTKTYSSQQISQISSLTKHHASGINFLLQKCFYVYCFKRKMFNTDSILSINILDYSQ